MRPTHAPAAAAWLALQPWFATWTAAPKHYETGDWRTIAEAVKGAGFFSRHTVPWDVPVGRIVTAALAIRSESSEGN
jgi:hypothetical protein